jgi:hypothetical protein
LAYPDTSRRWLTDTCNGLLSCPPLEALLAAEQLLGPHLDRLSLEADHKTTMSPGRPGVDGTKPALAAHTNSDNNQNCGCRLIGPNQLCAPYELTATPEFVHPRGSTWWSRSGLMIAAS